jgi:hypothetical protein
VTPFRCGLLVAALVAGSVIWSPAPGSSAAPQASSPLLPRLPATRLVSAGWPPAMLAAPAAAPPSAASLPGVCLPIVSCDPTAGLAGDAARTAARGSLDALGGWISDGALALLGQVTDEMGRTTAPTLDASWFLAHAQVMETLAVLVLLPLLLASIMGALVHQDPGRLIRTVAVHLPLALGGGFVAVLLTGMALSLTDQLCDFVSVGLHNDVVGSVGNIGLAMRAVSETTLNPGAGGFLGFLVALLVTLGALLIWLELLLRSAAIYVAVMFLPLALSGLVWPVTARWAKRLVEILVALILSKFVVVAVISLATGAVAANPKDGVAAGLGGGALLLLAGFAPFAVLRLVPVVEASVVGHLEGSARRPVTAGVGSTQMVHRLIQGAAAGGGGGAMAAATPLAGAAATVMAMPAKGDAALLSGLGAADGQTGEAGSGGSGSGSSGAGPGRPDVVAPAGLGRPGTADPTPTSVSGGDGKGGRGDGA